MMRYQCTFRDGIPISMVGSNNNNEDSWPYLQVENGVDSWMRY